MVRELHKVKEEIIDGERGPVTVGERTGWPSWGGHLGPRARAPWPCAPVPVLLPILQLRKPRRRRAEGLARVCAPPWQRIVLLHSRASPRVHSSARPGGRPRSGMRSKAKGSQAASALCSFQRLWTQVVFYDSATSDPWV